MPSERDPVVRIGMAIKDDEVGFLRTVGTQSWRIQDLADYSGVQNQLPDFRVHTQFKRVCGLHRQLCHDV
jgi:hypothetical protein